MNSWVLKHDLIECFLAQTFPVVAYSHIVIVRQCNSQVNYTPERLPTKTPSTLETTIKTRQGHHQTNRPTPCPTFGDIPSLPDMAFCCGEETKLGAEAKTPKIQHLVEVVEGGCWRVVGLWRVEIELEKWGEILYINNWIFKQKSNEKIFESRWISFFFLERTLLKGIEI